MTKLTRILARGTYAIMGAAYLAAGLCTLLVNTGLLPDAVRDAIVVTFGQNNSGFLHILQELGSLLVRPGCFPPAPGRYFNQGRRSIGRTTGR